MGGGLSAKLIFRWGLIRGLPLGAILMFYNCSVWMFMNIYKFIFLHSIGEELAKL